VASVTSEKLDPGLQRPSGTLDGLRYFLHFLDAPILYVIFVAAYRVRFESGLFSGLGADAPSFTEYRLTFAAMALGWVAFLWASGVYQRLRFGFQQFFLLVGQLVTAGGVSLAVFFFRRDFSYSRITIVLSFLGATLGLSLFHYLKSRFLLALLRRGYGRRPVVAVGPRDLALSCLARFAADPELVLELRGYLEVEPGGGEVPLDLSLTRVRGEEIARPYLQTGSSGPGRTQDLEQLAARYPRLGGLAEVEEVVEREAIQELFVVNPLTDGSRLLEILRRCENTSAAVRVVPDLMSIIAHGVRMRLVGGVPVLDVGRSSMEGLEGLLKRALDMLGAGVGLVGLAPLYAYLAYRVKRDSPGPVLYSQERVGMDGRPFTIYKFRSMPVDAEASSGPVWSGPGDERATDWGAFMRKWSLDELPQLYNVLRGDMSLVGPRPERPHFVNQFRQDIQGYMQRHKVKAGITGWAQINGLRGECPIESRTRYDIWYIENWSLALDLEILFRTVWLCFFHPDGNS
jgi:Undecaprenyl-phosphate glucose phosphotransferase